jgi:hypothetical protein
MYAEGDARSAFITMVQAKHSTMHAKNGSVRKAVGKRKSDNLSTHNLNVMFIILKQLNKKKKIYNFVDVET